MGQQACKHSMPSTACLLTEGRVATDPNFSAELRFPRGRQANPPCGNHRKDGMVASRTQANKCHVRSPCGVGAHLAARETSLSLPSVNASESNCSCSAKATATDKRSSWNLSAEKACILNGLAGSCTSCCNSTVSWHQVAKGNRQRATGKGQKRCKGQQAKGNR